MKAMLNGNAGLPPDELQNYLPDVWKRDLMAEHRAAPSAHHATLVRAISPSLEQRAEAIVARMEKELGHSL